MKKRLWATILVLCMALGMLPGTAWAASIVRYGECGTEGDNLTYTLDSEGKLTISGKGALKNDFGPHLEASIHPNGEWTAIKTVEFEDGVTSIGNDAFTQCYGLRSVTIPSSITTIGRRAFSDCSSLTSINIPNSVTSIGDGAFGNCSSLTSVNIPNGITSIGSGVFGGCSSLTNINIPSGVTGIGSGAFQSCTGLTNINIPNGVTSIGSSAFNGCNSLVSINIPNSVPTIEYSTFQNCTSLTSINVPNSVTSIERWAFSGCTSLTSVTIPDSVTTIKDSAFEDCTSLTSINIPNSVTSIGHYLGGAFAGCTSLTSATIPDSVTSIRDVFAGCTNLTSVTIQKGVTSIKDGCFSDCTRLTSVTIPDSVTVIGGSAFWRCTNLTSVTIPSSVTTIGDSAFSSSGLTSIIIPNSVTTIGEDAFSSTDLTNIIIPNSITNISDSAFCACASLSSVTIPNSVTTIGTNAFSACTKLTDVYYTGNKSQWKAIEIGVYNDYLTSATIHYNSSGSGTDTPDFADYAYFGKMDSWNRSVVIDGVEYSFTEEFKNSPANLPYLSAGNYLDNYVYALFNLNEASQISSLQYITGIPCKLEDWNSSDSIVDTSLEPIFIGGTKLKPGDYRVSEITKGSFPTDQIADWIGDDIRVYTSGEEIFKLIHIEHKTGVITSFDPNGSPLTVYIDDVAYPVAGKDKDLVEDLVDAIRYPFAKVVYTLYDGTLVEVISKADIKPSVSVDAGSNTSLSYTNGAYSQYKNQGTDSRLRIGVKNYVEKNLFNNVVPDFDITIESIQLTGDNIISIPFPYNTAIKVPEDKQLLHAGGSYTMSVPFTFNNGHVPYEGEEASVSCIVTGKDSGGNPITLKGSITFTVTSVGDGGGQPPDQDGAALDALRKQLDGMTAVSLTHSELADHFSQKEVRSIEKFLTVYITQMVNAPKVEEDQTFLQGVKKSVKKKAKEKLYKAMNINEFADLVKVDNLSSSVQVKKGRTTVNFDIKVSTYAWNGSTFGGLGQINFKIDGTNRTGTGIVTYADTESFSDAVMRYVKAGYNEAWGKDADKIVEAFLPKTINDLLSKTGSFSDKVFTLLTEPAKKYRKKLSVKAAADIYVYGANGTLLGSIVGGNIQNDGGNISCSLQGDTKEIFLEYGECIIKIVGSETEMITCTVEEYSEGRVSRTVSFENVALSRGVSYESNLTEQINIPVSEYVLRSNTGAIIPATRDENGTLSSGQPGDLTGDGKVTMADVIRLARGAAGYVTLTEQEQKVGDVNRDSKITMADVIRVARYAAGYSPAV